MRSSCFCPAAYLWCAYAAGFTPVPVLAQSSGPTPGTVTPLQGAAAVLDHAHSARNLAALNGDLSNESAALMGVTLDLTVSALSGLTLKHTPKGSQEAAVQKAYQPKAGALLISSGLTGKAGAGMNGSGALPPAFALQGHQFLSHAIALSDAYEKTGSPNKGGSLSAQCGRNAFPAARDFHVLSPTRVRIVPRSRQRLPIEAHLEKGQWRLEIRNRWPKASFVQHGKSAEKETQTW